jgi:large subunit ribosomal protein L28
MSKVCFITGKHPVTGGKIIRKGQTKKSGGIGTHIVKVTKRKFNPNLQRVRVILPSGQVKRVWVSARALKAGKVSKAPIRPKTAKK